VVEKMTKQKKVNSIRSTEDEEVHHPKIISYLTSGEQDKEIPPIIKIGALDIPVDQISGFQEENLYGDFNDRIMRLRVVVMKPPEKEQQEGSVNEQTLKSVNRETFLHEAMHVMDWAQYPAHQMTEDQVNAVATSLYEAMVDPNTNFCFTPSKIENTPTGCLEKEKDDIINVKECNFDINEMGVNVKIADFEENDEVYETYQRKTRLLKISDMKKADPSNQMMQLSLIEGWLEAVNAIKELHMKKDKQKHIALSIYDFLKRNNLCFKKEKEE
jgi:hypothetical protein